MLSDAERKRYFVSSGDIVPGGESTWYILDWDQRKTFGVTVDEYRFDEERAVEYLHNYVEQVDPDVCALFVSPEGELLRASSDAKDDCTYCVEFIPLAAHELPQGVSTICRSNLEELGRLGGNVDLVSCQENDRAEPRIIVFKYYFLFQFQNRLWDEMNLWMRLPRHPNIVPFDQVVTDELDGQVVGFTSRFIPGGTLEENNSRIFKLKYLKQLMPLVDELNLKYNIAHQDLAPRNLLLDAETDNIMVFDFNFSARIGGKCFWENRNDVKGPFFTMYEIITEDVSFRSIPFDKQDMQDIIALDKWPQHAGVKLDHDVSEFRQLVTEWALARGKSAPMTTDSEDHSQAAAHPITWPPVPEPPLRECPTFVMNETGNWVESVIMQPTLTFLRIEAEKKGRKVLRWERPSSRRMAKGARLLATGEPLSTQPANETE